MARATTKADFINKVKRKLGYPKVPINISDDQWDDITFEALDFYTQNIINGTTHKVLAIETTAGQYEYDLDALFSETGNSIDIFEVVEVLNPEYGGQLFPAPYGVTQDVINFYFSIGRLGHGDLVDGEIMFENLETYKKVYLPKMHWNFNYNEQKLYLKNDPNGQKLTLLVELLLDYDGSSSSRVWSNQWLCNYAVAIAKGYWAANMGGNLVDGATSPGGANVNLQGLKDEGKQEKQDLETFAYENLAPNFYNIVKG